MSIDEALARLQEEVDERRVRQVVKSTFSAVEGEGEAEHEY
jgi:hypothetical protein